MHLPLTAGVLYDCSLGLKAHRLESPLSTLEGSRSMKKRSNLAKRIKTIFSLFLICTMITAFFYAPMSVNAKQYSGSVNGSSFQIFELKNKKSDRVNLGADGSYKADTLYKVDMAMNYSLAVDSYSMFSSTDVSFGNLNLFSDYSGDFGTSITLNKNLIFYLKGSELTNTFVTNAILFDTGSDSKTYTISYDYTVNSITAVTDPESYDKGYKAGYQAGVESVDTQSYYDSGFQAGAESVDTQSYYDSGYQAGAESVDTQSYYDSGYKTGYDTGFKDGVDSVKLPDVDVNTGGLNAIFDRLDKLGDVVSSLTDNMTGKKKKKTD